MSIDEYIKKLDGFLVTIDREADLQMARAGADIAALVSNRVIQTGKTASGGRFSSYSTTQIPAFFYLGKSRTGAAENAVKNLAKKKELISYSDFRRINGLNTAYKTFEFTGSMWRNFRTIKIEQSGDKYNIVVGGAIQSEQNKIDWLSAQENQSIIKPSDKELSIIKANLTAWLTKIVNG